ncbi:MAG TPA: CBS domain-containing protein [Solirubrobacteraceae bacterium]|nr:CBS domain-containing protein [Solirubrobacteraceae bacterium]
MNPSKLPAQESLLGSLTVADAMHHGIVTCPPSAGLREVAELLAENGVHCAIVAEPVDADEAGTLWGIVSDVDLMRGLGSPVPLTAGNLAAMDLVTVTPGDELQHAARLMGEHDVAHLIVVADGRPAGILSTLDVARAVARA